MGNMALYVYLAPMLIIWPLYLRWRNSRQRIALKLRDQALEAGLGQPASLHPVIDTSRCIGCRSCVSACPENDVLGIISDKAELISPANCIGHGACFHSCPVEAISLVIGTEHVWVEEEQTITVRVPIEAVSDAEETAAQLGLGRGRGRGRGPAAERG